MAEPAQEKQPEQSTTNASPALPLMTIGGRKFALVGFCSLMYTFLLIWGYVGENIYMNLQVMTVGAFIAGNAVGKFAENRRDK